MGEIPKRKKNGVWRRQVARRFWELKVIGSNPISPKKSEKSGKSVKSGMSPNGRATVFGAVGESQCGFESYHSRKMKKKRRRKKGRKERKKKEC